MLLIQSYMVFVIYVICFTYLMSIQPLPKVGLGNFVNWQSLMAVTTVYILWTEIYHDVSKSTRAARLA